MKKLLALAALAVLTLTACGPDTGKAPSGPPALIQPADHTPAPATEVRFLTEVGADSMYEVTGTNSSGKKFRCYTMDGNSSVSQTCFEYGPAS